MSRHQRAFKSYWSVPEAPMSMGCVGCPELNLCGGQRIFGSGFSCLDHCCGNPKTCQTVCPNSHVFADRVREVRGFNLETPPATPLASPMLPSYLPMLFHGSARVKRYQGDAVAIPLYRFFDGSAECRFQSIDSVADFYRFDPGTHLLLSGVAQDDEVERWWKLETRGRLQAIANFRRIGVAMVTTPNFSLIVDRPRWDDMHSMRRIACAHHELISEGQPAALHVNGRSQHDFLRWTEYVVAHPEVTHIAYEFTTGARSVVRMVQHAAWLVELAKGAGRRLGLITRGGVEVAGLLSQYYDLSYIDSSAFEKAQFRETAFQDSSGQRRWVKKLTDAGEPVDAHFEQNVEVSKRWFEGLLPKLQIAA